MKLFSKNWLVLFSLLGILLLGFFLRFHNYKVWPRDGATFDEYAWTFLGMSLLDTHIPTSWSPHKEYSTRTHFINSKGASFFLVTPYLEHPPLFGLIAGAYAKMIGLKDFDEVHSSPIRPLALFLGILAIIAVYLFTSEMIGRKTGLIAAFLYAIFPSVVIGSRLVQNENFFIPFFLLSLYFTLKYIHTGNTVWGACGIIVSALLPLAKIPWIVAPLAVTALLWSEKKYRDGMLVLFSTFGFLMIFFLYGMRLDSNLFVNLWKLQLSRYDISFDGIFALFKNPIITDRYYLDGLFILGLLCIPLVLKSSEQRLRALFYGFFSYFCIYLYSIPNEPGHGWYRYPLYPFLIIAIAVAIRKYFLREPVITFFILSIPGLAALSTSWQEVFGFSYGVYRSFLIACFISLLPLLFPNKIVKKFSNVISILVLLFVIGITIWSGYLYTEQ